MDPRIVRTYKASGAIANRRLVKFGASDGVVSQASAATDAIIGVVDYPNGCADGEVVDVVLFGPADVDAGGTIARGVRITADANGKAVAAAPAAGVNNPTAGIILVSAVSGDIAPAFVQPSQVQG